MKTDGYLRLKFLDEELERSVNLLTNKGFLTKAPKELVDKEIKKFSALSKCFEEIIDKEMNELGIMRNIGKSPT